MTICRFDEAETDIQRKAVLLLKDHCEGAEKGGKDELSDCERHVYVLTLDLNGEGRPAAMS